MVRSRSWLRRNLSPAAVDKLRAARHITAQAVAGADLYHLRVELEQRIEDRLRETEASQDARLHAQILSDFREELTSELDRWAQDMMDRMDLLLSASNRLIASLEARVADLERRLSSSTDVANGHSPAPASRVEQSVKS